MDVPIINESCFSAANPCSYSLTEIWPPPPPPSLLENPNNKQYVTLELSAERQLSVDDSSLTFHSRSRNNTISDFQSSRVISDKDLKDSSSKRFKVLVSNQENSVSKDAAEASSGSGNKPAEPVKDYVHVRAKRGQATDSHSLAERARREKISERMKILQDLVPGCNKVVGKALVLDEIINYIQSLQNQVEFLSMKLEAVNSMMEPAVVGFPMKNLGVPTLDASGLIFRSQSPQEYARGSQRDWLHMQIGSTIDKQLDT